MIEPFDMAEIYWRNIKGKSVHEVSSLVFRSKHASAKAYWAEVLTYLNVRKNGKASLQ